MSFKELRREKRADDCLLDPPEWACCKPCCPDPCRPKCCPKTRVWDCIDIYQDEMAHKFELQKMINGAAQAIAAYKHCIELTIRERGYCDPVVIIEPTRAELDGTVWFDWPHKFTSAPAGYYEADLKINGEECLTICLHKLGCWAGAHSRDRLFVEDCQDDCHTCTDDRCCEGTRPSPDFDDRFNGDCDVQRC